VGLFDRVRIRILKDLPNYFDNGEFPGWKAGDEADAEWVKDGTAHIDYG